MKNIISLCSLLFLFSLFGCDNKDELFRPNATISSNLLVNGQVWKPSYTVVNILPDNKWQFSIYQENTYEKDQQKYTERKSMGLTAIITKPGKYIIPSTDIPMANVTKEGDCHMSYSHTISNNTRNRTEFVAYYFPQGGELIITRIDDRFIEGSITFNGINTEFIGNVEPVKEIAVRNLNFIIQKSR